MPYATEVEYRAALAAYRALHKVFYRFYASVRAQHPGAWADQLPADPMSSPRTSGTTRAWSGNWCPPSRDRTQVHVNTWSV